MSRASPSRRHRQSSAPGRGFLTGRSSLRSWYRFAASAGDHRTAKAQLLAQIQGFLSALRPIALRLCGHGQFQFPASRAPTYLLLAFSRMRSAVVCTRVELTLRHAEGLHASTMSWTGNRASPSINHLEQIAMPSLSSEHCASRICSPEHSGIELREKGIAAHPRPTPRRRHLIRQRIHPHPAPAKHSAHQTKKASQTEGLFSQNLERLNPTHTQTALQTPSQTAHS